MNPTPPSRGRNVSPLSTDSTDSAFALRYQSFGAADSPYAGAAAGGYSSGRPGQTSPPVSQHPSGSTDNSFPSRPSHRTPSTANSHVSSASSIARSSDGNGMYSAAMSDSGRMSSMSRSGHEEALQEHYNVLKAFLASYLRDEAGNSKRTKAKAKDKLLRLSATQFQELSTDVYDELLRREDERLRRVPNVPRYLLPRNNFHPKRNQARQKLSTLPQEKFLLLATDVFYELERRFPRFAGGDNDQVASPAVSVGSSQRAPSRNGPSNGMPNGMRPPPSGSGGMRGPPMPNAQSPTLDGSTYQPQSLRGSGNGPRPAPGPRSGSDNSAGNDLGRPLPQTLQSNTIIANKSTMVEDDESEEEDDTFGLEKVINGIGRGSVDRNVDSGTDKEALRAYESQVKELRETVNVLEEKLRVKEADHDRLQTLSKKRDAGIDTERDEWSNMRNDLEKQVSEAQDLAATLQTQLEQARQSNNKAEADMRAGMEHTVSSLQLRVDELTADNNRLRSETRKAPGSDSDEWRQRYNDLQDELVDQQKLTEDVRHQATQFLQEMRTLSEQSEAALEKEERLRCQVASLEAEIQEWKTRYAKTKTQLRTLKATSTGPPLKQISSGALDARQDLVSGSGLVNDVDVTKFQMAIEELVHAARDASSETVIDRMKDVVHCVRAITAGDESETQGLASPILSGSMSLHPDGTSFSSSTPKGRVLVEAKHLITAARNYASANGLSPVSLLDAATGNLTAAVVEYLRQAGIKPTPREELHSAHDDDDDDSHPGGPPVANGSPETNKGTPPKTNGWFARLKGSMDSSYGSENATKPTHYDDDEYDPYR